MTPLTLLAIGAGFSQVLLSGALLLSLGLESRSGRLFALLLLGAIGYLLTPLVNDGQGHPVMQALATSLPGVFWLFCASLFDDHYTLPAWQPALVIYSVVAPLAWHLLGQPAGGPLEWLLQDLPQLLEFVFMLLALRATFRYWRGDLVEVRRKLRVWFCAGTGVFMFSLILSREVLFAGADWLQGAQYIATAVVLLGINIMLLRYPTRIFDPARREPEATPPPANASKPVEDDPVEALAPIRRLIMDQGIYREHGMTIGRLASAAEMPEYRLRQLINSGLGYRNFNDFLNRFRIEEASARLADPHQSHLPVLTIALDVGFRSISSFNKCFKDQHGVTPTTYRKNHLKPLEDD
ncbi:AraC family transcriptional regulator [Marinihelvus fidelis]|uniref:AraC family transcriptional regulator n=1 Tax=Marinihelvus fidelis TaxID=2613842 RepID=UPI00177AE4EB|nr:helix-turn-helix domain-containing protein [Marinihelvus fidelis]